jgi:hypothetical protein
VEKRDDPEGIPQGDETEAQRLDRRKAAALGLIGLSVGSHRAASDDVVTVELNAWVIGLALRAADDRGLLGDI